MVVNVVLGGNLYKGRLEMSSRRRAGAAANQSSSNTSATRNCICTESPEAVPILPSHILENNRILGSNDRRDTEIITI